MKKLFIGVLLGLTVKLAGMDQPVVEEPGDAAAESAQNTSELPGLTHALCVAYHTVKDIIDATNQCPDQLRRAKNMAMRGRTLLETFRRTLDQETRNFDAMPLAQQQIYVSELTNRMHELGIQHLSQLEGDQHEVLAYLKQRLSNQMTEMGLYFNHCVTEIDGKLLESGEALDGAASAASADSPAPAQERHFASIFDHRESADLYAAGTGLVVGLLAIGYRVISRRNALPSVTSLPISAPLALPAPIPSMLPATIPTTHARNPWHALVGLSLAIGSGLWANRATAHAVPDTFAVGNILSWLRIFFE